MSTQGISGSSDIQSYSTKTDPSAQFPHANQDAPSMSVTPASVWPYPYKLFDSCTCPNVF